MAFTVYVAVDATGAREAVGQDGRSVEHIVSDEIESNLASLDYVDTVVVRKKLI